jgi:hypothetical protein
MIGDPKVFAHRLRAAVSRSPRIRGIVSPGVIADTDSCLFQFRRPPDDFCEPFLLVGRQGIHRVKDDRLDTLLAVLLCSETMVEDREQEAFRLTATGAGSDDRRPGFL